MSSILNLLDMTLEYAEINARNRFISPSRALPFLDLDIYPRENICVTNFGPLVMINYFSDTTSTCQGTISSLDPDQYPRLLETTRRHMLRASRALEVTIEEKRRESRPRKMDLQVS